MDWRVLRSVTSIIAAGLIFAVALQTGCNRDGGDTKTVPPPSSNAPDRPAPEKPAGGIGLPPGDIPSGETPAGNTDEKRNGESGGIRMPDSDASNQSSVVKPQFATWTQVQQAATTSGKVTVLDVWSLTCVPCLKEFPGLVRLHEVHGDTISCIGFDLDFDGRRSRPPQTYEADVTKFLARVGATFPNYISETANDEVFETAGLKGLPAVLVYDADGKLVQRFGVESGPFTYDKDIIPLVAKLAGK